MTNEDRGIVYIPIDEVAVDQMNMRTSIWHRDEDDMELVQSIKENGILAPLVLRPVKNPPEEMPNVKYGIIAGNRRYQAALEAGLDSLPCTILEDCDDLTALGVSFQENVHRRDVSGYDKLRQIGRMVEFLHDTPKDKLLEILVLKTGVKEWKIKEYINFLDLPVEIQELAKDPKDRDDDLLQKLEDLGVSQDMPKLTIRKGAILARHSQDFSKERFVELVVHTVTLHVSEEALPELISAAKVYPKLPIADVFKEQVQEIPKGESIRVYLSNLVAKGLRNAGLKFQTDRETLAAKYIEKGLRDDGFC